MDGINKAIILGRLTKEPDTRYTGDSRPIAAMSVATNKSWKNKQTGNKEQSTEYHRASAFGPLAEFCGQYLKKGDIVYIEGEIKTRKFQDSAGIDRWSTEIIVTTLQAVFANTASATPDKKPRTEPKTKQATADADGFDDIPF